ncbi:MAG: HAAS signaling domain-containing protein [Fimbriimonadales bacterium]
MGKYIDWYLVELEGRIKGRLPEAAIGETLAEVEQHLLACAGDLEKGGAALDEAEKEATRRFGSPTKIAWSLIQTQAPRAAQPLSKWPVIWAAVGTAWAGFWLVSGWYPISLLMVFYGLPVVGLFFCIASLRSRRPRPWGIFGMAGGGTLATLCVLSVTWLNLYLVNGRGLVARWQEADYRATLHREIGNFDSIIPKMQAGVDAFPSADYDPAQEAFRVGRFWRVPSRPAGGWTSGPPVAGSPRRADRFFGLVDSRDDAFYAWKKEGRAAISSFNEARASEERDLAAIDQAKNVPILERLRAQAPEIIGAGIFWTGLLLVANFVCVWLGEAIRWAWFRTLRVA